jgi:UDP-2,4-diacetamido-2,4,6-trideoxy-beta-L-altropyranose hydrolase
VTLVMVVRTDAGVAIGLGHAMRCLALAQALTDTAGGRAVFLMAEAPAAFVARAGAVIDLDEAPGTGADAERTVAHARSVGADWVVVDGYHFDGGYQRALVDAGLQVLALDDHGHAGRYAAQLVLNQNLGAQPETYADREPYTRLLLGPRYVLLRREFRLLVPAGRPVAERARRVLVTLGGSDPDNVSARVLEALAQVPGPLEIQVLVGGANPHRDALERAAAAAGHQVELVADARDVPARMAWADLAVAAPGGSAWELARVGTPQVSIVLADNQRPAGAALAAAGLASVLGWHADVGEDAIAAAVTELAGDHARRAELVARGRALIDGRGPERVLAAMGPASS